MQCKYCGANIDNVKFCPYCGGMVANEVKGEESNSNLTKVPVVVLKKYGWVQIYYPDCVYTDEYKGINVCKKHAIQELTENFCDFEEHSEDDLMQDKLTQKMLRKGYDVSIDYLEVDLDKLEEEFHEEDEDDFDDTFDDEDEDGVFDNKDDEKYDDEDDDFDAFDDDDDDEEW